MWSKASLARAPNGWLAYDLNGDSREEVPHAPLFPRYVRWRRMPAQGSKRHRRSPCSYSKRSSWPRGCDPNAASSEGGVKHVEDQGLRRRILKERHRSAQIKRRLRRCAIAAGRQRDQAIRARSRRRLRRRRGAAPALAGLPQDPLAGQRPLYSRRPEGHHVLIRGLCSGSPGEDHVFDHEGTHPAHSPALESSPCLRRRTDQ